MRELKVKESDVFLSDFFEVLWPVTVKSEFFLPQSVKSLHDSLDTSLESVLELSVVLIPSLDYELVMLGIGYLDILTDLSLLLIYWGLRVFRVNRDWHYWHFLNYSLLSTFGIKSYSWSLCSGRIERQSQSQRYCCLVLAICENCALRCLTSKPTLLRT